MSPRRPDGHEAETMFHPIDYHWYFINRLHEEDLARAARHRQLPRRERPPTRWRSHVAAQLHRLADRVAAESAAPAAPAQRRAP
jgi:hypothetical protein